MGNTSIYSRILELRDEIEEQLKLNQVYNVKKLLDECVKLENGLFDDNITKFKIDKLSFYLYLADVFNVCGRRKLSLSYNGKALKLACEISDETNENYIDLPECFRTYIYNRYIYNGSDSSDLIVLLDKYLGNAGLELLETTIAYAKTAPLYDKVEDSEGYLKVIDMVEEKLSHYPKEKHDEYKKQLLANLGIKWQSFDDLNFNQEQ